MRRRGLAIILVLLLVALVLLMGLAFLQSRGLQHRVGANALGAATARALAQAGLEDARAKLNKDISFPPVQGGDQTTFSYAEELVLSDGSRAGSYQVTVDVAYRQAPSQIVRITSEGLVGAPGNPTARWVLLAEWDAAPDSRTTPGLENPSAGQFLSVRSLR